VADEENKQVYARYIELLNAQDFDALHEVVDPERYREICVGVTQGWVTLREAVASRWGGWSAASPSFTRA